MNAPLKTNPIFFYLVRLGLLFLVASPLHAELGIVVNAGFETGNLKGWNEHGWLTKRAEITGDAYSGEHALQLGPSRANVTQTVLIESDSLYRLTAMVRASSGAEELQIIIGGYGGVEKSVSSSLTAYRERSLDFRSARAADTVRVTFRHPNGNGYGFVDDVKLTRLGDAPPFEVQEIMEPEPRVIRSEGAVSQQPDEVMDWFLDAKFGMFIHWGVYAAMDEGSEWVMHNRSITPEDYRKRAENPKTGFTASNYDPSEWAELAKLAGMRYVTLTTRHHDGYALFESDHENSWTSVQHLGRNLIQEYVDAIREAGLRVGMYYSPMSWRYPGYYNVTGDDMLPNNWNYESEPWHKENARVMKEEVYEQVTRLMKDYGPIDYMFWDGAWLGQTVNHEKEVRFWDSGRYQNPENEWPIAEKYKVYEEETGQALGIMGLVREFQPDLIVNERFSWVGDVHGEEGVSKTAGPIRNGQVMEKCMSLMKGGWGYRPDRDVWSFEEVTVYLADCAVRNINLLLNVAPDRTGKIPDNQREVLLQIGGWLDKVGDAFFGTRGGPWQPLYGEYGFTYTDNRIFCHVFADYQHIDADTFTTQSLGGRAIETVRQLQSGENLEWIENDDGTITIHGVDYIENPAVTILEIVLENPVYADIAR